MQLSEQVALVTGGGAGIGEAVSLRLAGEGAAVVVADIDLQGARSTVALIKARAGQAVALRADVTSEVDVGGMVAEAEGRFGALDIVVNNAGGADEVSFPVAPPERWSRVLDVNLRGVMLVIQASLPAMRRRGGGVFVNVASLAGVGTGPHDSPDYAAAKAGVVRLTAALGGWAQEGIRVNCVCPDWVDTPASRRTRSRMTPEEQASLPPRLLTPEDIADGVMTFVSDRSFAGRVMERWCGEPRGRLVPSGGLEGTGTSRPQ